MRFHITDDGPKRCSAKQGNCPITKGTEAVHYDDLKIATKVYEESMPSFVSFEKSEATSPSLSSPVTRTFAPQRPNIVEPTLDEANEGLRRARSLFLSGKQYRSEHKALQGEVVSYGLAGSVNYNLHHPDSDRDLVILTDTTKGTDFHHVFDDGMDVRVSSVFIWAERFMKGTPADVDLKVSGNLYEVPDSPLTPYLNSLRYNRFRYIDTTSRHSKSDVLNGLNDTKNPKRASKSLKTALRNEILSYKYAQTGQLQVKFSDEGRELFYKNFDELESWAKSFERDNLDEPEVIEIGMSKLREFAAQHLDIK